ncbi:hypothetical protein [Aeromonas media]|uniref:hypothetical protein n=1 Tax=Aeromonas media TaxID=651 RepID=UPI001924057D|nr:hypothetical protein [Aeromonas media]MBL0511832.1 hypothetical protein [Aeromonas media]
MGLLNSAGIIVLATAFLFGSSTAYTNALLGTLGLDSDLMERSFHQVLYHGFIINLLYIVMMPFVLFSISYLAYEAKDTIHRAFRSVNGNRFSNARKYLKPLRRIGVKFKRESYIMKRLGTVKAASWLTFTVILLLMTIIVLHEQAGKAKGLETIKKIRQGESSLIYIDGDAKGYPYLYCGARNCAVYDVENNRIKYFPQNGFSISRKETSAFYEKK